MKTFGKYINEAVRISSMKTGKHSLFVKYQDIQDKVWKLHSKAGLSIPDGYLKEPYFMTIYYKYDSPRQMKDIDAWFKKFKKKPDDFAMSTTSVGEEREIGWYGLTQKEVTLITKYAKSVFTTHEVEWHLLDNTGY